MSENEISIMTEYIKLDSLLKFTGMTETGGLAKEAIKNGKVYVNGDVCTMRGKKIKSADTVSFNGIEVTVK